MSDQTQAPSTVRVTINGKQIDAPPGQLVIDTAEEAGVYIPRFCYHPRMKPVGMCRMCVVDIDTGRGAALQPSCMIPVADGMVVDTESEVTKKAQDGVLEFLLINHPLDCPVCDKGGECPLQDQTFTYGPGESRFVEEKRHFAKPIPISETVYLDRERCILCDRCTRFAKEVAGDPLIHFINRGNQTEVNTFPDHPFASYFSGNTVQICPVGALTARPYRFRARPWDLDQVESTCTSCSVGCRVIIDASRNELLRYNGVDVDPVNWGWLCDKGRFDFEAVNSSDRLTEPLVREGGQLVPSSWGAALRVAATAIEEGLARSGPSGIGIIGGARLTNEDAYAWAKLAKGILGTDNVDAQLGDGLPATAVLGLQRATIDDACQKGGNVLLLAPDLKEELPVLYLRLRHAVEEDGVTVIELVPATGSTSALAAASLGYRPGEAVDVVRALLAGGGDADAGGVSRDALRAAAALVGDGPITVVLGRANLAESADGIVAAAALLAGRSDTRFLSALRRANVHGALDMGLAPGVLPGRVGLDDGRKWFGGHWPSLPSAAGLDTTGILSAAADGKIDTLVLLGADPLADFPDRDLATRALAAARTVIATDLFLTESSRQADVVLAAAGYAEVPGTTTNIEGRITILSQKITPPGTARRDWIIASDIARRLGHDLGLESMEDIWAEIEAVAPSHAGVTLDLLRSSAAHDGVVVPLASGGDVGFTPTDDEGLAHPEPDADPAVADGEARAADAAVAAEASDDAASEAAAVAESTEAAADAAQADATAPEGGGGSVTAPSDRPGDDRPTVLTFSSGGSYEPPARDAYSLRLVASRKLYDLGTLVQHSPSMAGLAPGTGLRLHPHDFDRLGIAPGATVKVSSSRGSASLAAQPDPGVPRGAAAILFGQPGTAAASLIDATAPITDIRVEP